MTTGKINQISLFVLRSFFIDFGSDNEQKLPTECVRRERRVWYNRCTRLMLLLKPSLWCIILFFSNTSNLLRISHLILPLLSSTPVQVILREVPAPQLLRLHFIILSKAETMIWNWNEIIDVSYPESIIKLQQSAERPVSAFCHHG